MRTMFRILASIGVGLVLTVLLGILFDAMRWPIFHMWGLVHGSFILAWLLLTLISFGMIRAVWPRTQVQVVVCLIMSDSK